MLKQGFNVSLPVELQLLCMFFLQLKMKSETFSEDWNNSSDFRKFLHAECLFLTNQTCLTNFYHIFGW